MKINFMNVGEGDMTILEIEGKIVLIDVNISSRDDEAYKILKQVAYNGIIDYLIITHPHNDHIKGIDIIDEDFEIRNIWESGFRFEKENEEDEDYQKFINIIERKGSYQLKASKEKIDFPDENVEIYCLNSKNNNVQDDSPEGIHYNCLVIKLIYKNISILFTGDSNWKVWNEKILGTYDDLLNSDILHASHHGSRTFFMLENEEHDAQHNIEHLEDIEPQYTIISAWTNEEKNKAGKPEFPPHEDAIELYEEYTTEDGGVYITGNEGNIIFNIEENSINLDKASKCGYVFSKGRRQKIKEYKENTVKTRHESPTKMMDHRFGE